ncbi:gamma-glutamyltransferase [Dehalococcoidia bacterium]|nr:gamma-glutamyltransferase [Dehalococcoidia bacterium]
MTTNTPTIANITKTEARSTHGMVATKDIHSTEAGLEMLEQNGNAIDAAVAACFAVGVVEPASSGIGGGGYLVFEVDGKGGVIGFPMRGPLNSKPDMYELTGEPTVGNFGWAGVVNSDNLEGYRSIATPGTVAGLCEAHRRLGKLPLKEVVAPAVRLARNGFSPGWHNVYSLGTQADKLFKYQELRRVFMPGDGSFPLIVKQPELADVLELIGSKGPSAFYRGEVARAIVADIQSNGGILTERDFAEYKPFAWDDGLEFDYRGHTVRVPPFACAGTTSAMTLKVLNGFDIRSMGHNSAKMLHAYIYSARMANADRFKYLADPEFADVPWDGLVSSGYAKLRRSEINPKQLQEIAAGDPWEYEGRKPRKVLASSAPALDTGTTHLCVIDSDGNGVSLTNTIMSGFGSGIIPKGSGVVMNNGMMWYDPIPNRVNSIMPGKFPLNNMTPALILTNDGVKVAVGASGGRRITNCVTQLIIKMVDFGMGPQESIDSPRVDCSLSTTSVDPRVGSNVLETLESMGHRLHRIGNENLQTGFASFASPVAIIRESKQSFAGGVDTFHSAHAQGL